MEKQSTPINKLINGWNSLQKNSRSVLLLGYGNTGRSTFSQLVKKYWHRNKSNDLSFDANKYALENIIATKSIKLQTTIPVLYEKQHNNKDELKILDIPSYAFAPQNKKWTGLEQKLTLKYLIQKNENVVFLLFVDEKNTRSNVGAWKKSVQSFLQFFQLNKLQPNYDLFSSVAMIITKCPPEVKQDTMVKRLKQLQLALEKDKIFDQALIEKFCKVLTDNNKILTFDKVSDDQRQKDEIIKNCEILDKMQGYKINPQDFRELIFSPEEQKGFSSYFSYAEQIIENLVKYIEEVIRLQQFSQSNIQSIKKKYFSTINTDMKLTDSTIQKFENVKKKIDSFTFIKNYGNICQEIVKLDSEKDFLKLLDEIIKLNIFIDFQDQFLFQAIIEALEFKRISGIKMLQFQTYCHRYQNIFNNGQLRAKAFTRLVDAQQAVTDVNLKKDFYQHAVRSLRNQLRQIPQSLLQFLEKCNTELNKQLNPKTAVSFLLSSLKENLSQNKAYDYSNQIAHTFKAKEFYYDAARIFRLSKNPHEAIQCFRYIFTQSEETSFQYIKYLLELNLFADAKKASMQASARFGFKSRVKMGEQLKKIEESERRYFQDSSETNCLLQQISNSEIQHIKTIAQKALQKL